MDFVWDAPLQGDVAFALRAESYLRPQALDGWERAKAQFVLQNSCMVFDPLGSTSRDLQVLREGEGILFEYSVEWLVEIGLVRVARGLTCVLALRWVGGLSPEEGCEACRVLDALQQRRGWFMRAPIDKLQHTHARDQVDAISYALKTLR